MSETGITETASEVEIETIGGDDEVCLGLVELGDEQGVLVPWKGRNLNGQELVGKL